LIATVRTGQSQGWTGFEKLLRRDDVDVMAWAIALWPVPKSLAAAQMDAHELLEYIDATN